MIVPAATLTGPESCVIVTVGAASGRVGEGVGEDGAVDDCDGGILTTAVDGDIVVVELGTVLPVNGSLL